MIQVYKFTYMTYDKRQIKVYLRKGLKLNTDELDMRSVPSLLGRQVYNDSHEIEVSM